MRFLKFFSKSSPTLMKLPSGGFTVDRDGGILISTLPQTFPKSLVSDIARKVLKAFKTSQARELRGGAIIFLSPQSMSTTRN